ncbi:MAG: hypothetical protein J6P72_00670 [Firmicutes bacterium]|nr:hypothetical protein [Bacillota bacterium]
MTDYSKPTVIFCNVLIAILACVFIAAMFVYGDDLLMLCKLYIDKLLIYIQP